MATNLTPAFRATSGLDAAGEKVINVAKADFNTLSDGVNVDFFIEENTIQQYKEDRGYRKDFAAIQENRIWVSNRDIPAPAGPFVPEYWTAVRTDPKWKEIKDPTYTLKAGDYVTVDSIRSKCLMTLPSGPQDGDTIVIKDIGGNPGHNEIRVKASAEYLYRFGQQVQDVLISKPFSYNLLVFSNKVWNFYQTAQEERGIRITAAAEYRAQAGDILLRRYVDEKPVRVVLPTFANDGDMVHSVDIDGLGPQRHLIVRTEEGTSIGELGNTSKEFRTTGDGFFVYSSSDKLWTVWDGDLRTRIRIVRDNTSAVSNEFLTVMGKDNIDQQTIIIKFPTDVAVGDTIKIGLNYLRKKQTVRLQCATGDMFLTEIKLLQFPKRSEYPPDATWATEPELIFNGDTNYTPVIEFSYLEENGKNYWMVAQNVPTVERVDPLNDVTRKRLGVISLASQTEANTDHEQNPNKEAAITPETLANRTAQEDRRGIARIATTEQVNQITEYNFVDDVIITPKKLNAKQATETMRGVAETATQKETNDGIDDARIVTPKKLNDRKASETLTGIAKLVSTVGTAAAADRPLLGTNVYNKDNNVDLVTPKSLSQLKAVTNDQGLVYLATENEVITGASNEGFENGAVTPATLHKRVAKDDNHGLIEIATQEETDEGTDYTRAVTPKTLNDRKAREDLTGIARIATQDEFDKGELDTVISTPLKVKTRFNDPARTSVISASGLVETGTLWDHYTLDIQEASEDQRGTLKLATQTLTDTGEDDTTAVTPLKLHKKKATESSEGIIQVATQDEVVDGTEPLKAVPPVHLKYIVQEEKTWEASPVLRGFVKISENEITWKGDDTNGSVNNVDSFEKTGYAISPYELNKTLAHYLPINGKAFDSDKLDGLDSLQFIRRDVDQDVEGILTFKKQVNLEAPLVSSSTASFSGVVESKDNLVVGTPNGKSRELTVQASNNIWKYEVKSSENKSTFSTGGNAILVLNKSGDVDVTSTLTAKDINFKNTLKMNNTVVVKDVSGKIVLGDKNRDVGIETKDAGNLTITDNGMAYKVLTEKNVKEVVDREFVKKEGDTMTGRLEVLAPFTSTITEAKAVSPISDDTTGTWVAEITTEAIWKTLPGFMVPIMEGSTGVIIGYEEYSPGDYSKRGIRAPGTLAQFGSKNKQFTYQVWTPRPTEDYPTARSSQWMRTWNVFEDKFNEWGRVYTTEAPVTSNEIGAVSTAGSAFANLTIRDWLQIGNVRIEPDPVTRAVKFTWIDI